MAKLNLNLADIPSDVIPAGEYTAEISAVEVRTGKTSGKPYINWTFDLIDEAQLGRKMFMATSLSEKALFRVRDIFEVLGVDVSEAIDLDVDDETGAVLDPDFVGSTVVILVSVETDDRGRETSRVDTIVRSLENAAGPSSNGGSRRPLL